MNVLITGKSGYVAKSLANKLKGYSITMVGREDFDITDRNQTTEWFKDKYFDVIIHTAIVGGSRLKQDDDKVFYQNINIFYNLLANQNHFGQLINFGSGAELGYPTDPYGLSKNIIHRIMFNEPKFNNIRIFAVFDENELDTRFIKANIKKYLNKEPMVIHQNKYMDFFYMDDLVTLVEYIIKHPEYKEVECCYNQLYTLYDVAKIINNLSEHKCEIKVVESGEGKPYIGHPPLLDLPYYELETAIKKVYEQLN